MSAQSKSLLPIICIAFFSLQRVEAMNQSEKPGQGSGKLPKQGTTPPQRPPRPANVQNLLKNVEVVKPGNPGQNQDGNNLNKQTTPPSSPPRTGNGATQPTPQGKSPEQNRVVGQVNLVDKNEGGIDQTPLRSVDESVKELGGSGKFSPKPRRPLPKIPAPKGNETQPQPKEQIQQSEVQPQAELKEKQVALTQSADSITPQESPLSTPRSSSGEDIETTGSSTDGESTTPTVKKKRSSGEFLKKVGGFFTRNPGKASAAAVVLVGSSVALGAVTKKSQENKAVVNDENRPKVVKTCDDVVDDLEYCLKQAQLYKNERQGCEGYSEKLGRQLGDLETRGAISPEECEALQNRLIKLKAIFDDEEPLAPCDNAQKKQYKELIKYFKKLSKKFKK